MTKFYICHYCCEYITENNQDMKRHFKRKHKCDQKRIIDYNIARELSVHKKFHIDFDHTQLTSNYLIYITHKYKLFDNYISTNFLVDEVQNINTDNMSMYYNVHNLFHSNRSSVRFNPEAAAAAAVGAGVGVAEEDDLKNLSQFDAFRKIYWNEEMQKYICKKCSQGYTTKKNLINHMDTNRCEKNLKIRKIIMDNLTSSPQISPVVVNNIIRDSGVQNIDLNFDHNLSLNEEESEEEEEESKEDEDIRSRFNDHPIRNIHFDTIPDDFYDVDYDMEEFYENTKGYIYVIRVREFASLNQSIYKIGYTLESNIFNRIKHYPNGSELLGFFYVIDAKRYEMCIFDELDKLYFDKDALKVFKRKHGNEYYDIDPVKLYNVIYDVIRGGIIKKGDILSEIKKGKFRKLSLFYNDLFNKNISNMINPNMDIIKSYSYEERCTKFNELCEKINEQVCK